MPSYLGIDASLEGTGLCLVSEDGVVTRMETVRVPPGLRGMARLALIEDRVIDFLAEPADSHDRVRYVAIEGYAYNAVNQAFSLGEIGGVLRLRVHRRAVPYVDVPPVSLKKFATGRPEASKSEMIAAAIAAGASPGDDNQADAFHLARVAMAMVVPPAPRAQREVIHRLVAPSPGDKRRRPRRLVKNPV